MSAFTAFTATVALAAAGGVGTPPQNATVLTGLINACVALAKSLPNFISTKVFTE